MVIYFKTTGGDDLGGLSPPNVLVNQSYNNYVISFVTSLSLHTWAHPMSLLWQSPCYTLCAGKNSQKATLPYGADLPLDWWEARLATFLIALDLDLLILDTHEWWFHLVLTLGDVGFTSIHTLPQLLNLILQFLSIFNEGGIQLSGVLLNFSQYFFDMTCLLPNCKVCFLAIYTFIKQNTGQKSPFLAISSQSLVLQDSNLDSDPTRYSRLHNFWIVQFGPGDLNLDQNLGQNLDKILSNRWSDLVEIWR